MVAHSDLALLGRPLERPGPPAPRGEAVVVQTLPLAGRGDVLDVSVPLIFRDVRVGTAYVGFSQAGIVQAVGPQVSLFKPELLKVHDIYFG